MLMYPILDRGDLGKLVVTALLFVPVTVATIRMSQIKGWIWPSSVLMSTTALFALLSALLPNSLLIEIKWWALAAFFCLTVTALFSSFTKVQCITNAHLLTAVSIYLLIGLLFFAVYSAFAVAHPGCIQHSGSSSPADAPSELLYFSLITLSTVGYGDVVAVNPEVRMLAALEGIAGVLYVAITIALLVSGYTRRNNSA